jgi:hypothetical protein
MISMSQHSIVSIKRLNTRDKAAMTQAPPQAGVTDLPPLPELPELLKLVRPQRPVAQRPVRVDP